jgi:spermidine dehydrogenase
MSARITRRDLIHDAVAATLGLLTVSGMGAAHAAGKSSPYPPTRTGLRGSHPGAFEAAHALAREGRPLPAPRDLDENYDLVVVGAGISGLAAAHYYRRRFGDDVRILILDNHDDFGGHAKRNEFHQGGQLRLSLGGTHNLEWWKFSDTVNAFLVEHGVDVQDMLSRRQFRYGRNERGSLATWFDREHFGVDRLLPDCDLTASDGPDPAVLEQLPIPAAARERLREFYRRRENVLEGLTEEAAENYLRSISYPEFLHKHGNLPPEASRLFDKLPHGGWGVEMRALSAMEALESGYPGWNLIGKEVPDDDWDYPAAMWPDGNASLARLQVARLIPEVAPGTDAQNVALARFNYSLLDRDGASVRLRLSSTVLNTGREGDRVTVSYLRDGEMQRVRTRHCVLACYHSIIPHLCPALPEGQKDALRYQVKHPLLLSNVLLRDTRALDRLGIDAVNCPGRMHQSLFTFRGINTGGYRHDLKDSGPVSLVFWGTLSPPPEAIDIKAQLRASRARMLALSFEDYEREIRSVLDSMLGPAGFEVARDVLAITVNRWPHGYAYEYLDLWDEDWPEGQAPHEIARQPFGPITIANADAGASAYTHVSIDQAFRAVAELPD